MDCGMLKGMIEGATPWVSQSGLTAEVLEPRHVLLRLPGERHLNQVGHVYSGALFTLMEMAGAALLACSYPFGKYIPINKGMEIQFLSPAVTDVLCELSLSEEEANEMRRPIDEKGKGEWVLGMDCRDTEGALIAKAVCTYYVKKLG